VKSLAVGMLSTCPEIPVERDGPHTHAKLMCESMVIASSLVRPDSSAKSKPGKTHGSGSHPWIRRRISTGARPGSFLAKQDQWVDCERSLRWNPCGNKPQQRHSNDNPNQYQRISRCRLIHN
jgi:hypothetical protein